MFEEESKGGYYNSVVREALEDLRQKKKAYVFNTEQLDEVLEVIKGKIKVETKEKEGIYYLIPER